ncbi:ISAs1 family transposase [Bremerella cremea]|uniref:ISAs1 family transposase n=1 Tax=Bremerella cremea TaxID=1031537 RepID=A0A368KN87_9BACT|nr:ISAs1 family transposase [Bremerella cremea]RCS44664.1 ISAs1 family transposase [Bremerella cremea]
MKMELGSDDVVSILDYFADLEDPRSSINRKHLLGDLIVICIMAVIAGADGPRSIGMWAASNVEWLKRYLALPGGAPSHDTIGRLLATLKPNYFQQCFQKWIESLREDASVEEDCPGIIAIDGKTVRRSHDSKKGLGAMHLVSAWAVRGGISVGQLATEEKSNEITAIPELLEQINVQKSIVTIDAAGCQKEIAASIMDGGGDYVLALKGNQGTLHAYVRDYIVQHMENDFADVTARKFEENLKGHGRTETLVYYQLSLPKDLPGKAKWKGLRTIGVAIRMSEEKGKHTSDVRYYISSLRLGVKQFAEAVRKHWSIENTLHWCLDMTFREDDSRVRNRLATDNLAWLKRFAITLLKQQPSKESIAMRRRMAGWNADFLAEIIGV